MRGNGITHKRFQMKKQENWKLSDILQENVRESNEMPPKSVVFDAILRVGVKALVCELPSVNQLCSTWHLLLALII